ncbi:MAG TPA: hypothetical protein VGF34_17925 [Stellaceae bacterium]|jgi:hypothetical protein
MADRLTLTKALESGGMQSAVAERIATEIYDAIHGNVATKADVGLVQIEIAALRAEMREMEQRLDRRIDATVTRLWAFIVIIAGLLFAALHYWPPHG